MAGAEPAAGALSPDEARRLFPELERTTYLATNGQALLPEPTRERLRASVDLLREGFGGAMRLDAGVETVRAQVAALVGAGADEIAFVRNTGEGLCLVADLVDWRPGDELLTFAGEYRSVVHAFQGAAHRGLRVRVAEPDAHGCITAERVAAELRPATRAVALSWVRYDTGARADLAAIGRVLGPAGVLFVVDGIQGLGALPIDVRSAGVDFLAAGAHKWLLGVSGTGVLYVRRERLGELLPTHLGVTGMRDAETLHARGDPYRVCPLDAARRVEEGSRNALGIAALGASLELHARVGAAPIAARIKAVTDRLCEGFRAAGGRPRSPRGGDAWSGVLLLEPPAGVDAEALAARMLRERIVIGAREGALWGSAHYFNSREDAERVLAFL
ncbi:MAG: aminotransferase class V-fold PLP-dependent enzyme [Myxococcota bacterium]|nr:aminotransferase class V-fold PLP-dependent enzyme [Myxococcota bacterium]